MTATDPEKQPAGEYLDDATNKGKSAEDAAEGSDDLPGEDEGSPHRGPAGKLVD